MHRPQIWIPEIEYYQIVSSHAQIRPQGAEKQLRKVNVGGGGGWVVVGVWPKTRTALAQIQIRSAELVNYLRQTVLLTIKLARRILTRDKVDFLP